MYIVDSEKVEAYKKEKKDIPEAIIENTREAVTRLYLKNGE